MLQTPRHLEHLTERVGSWISMRFISHLLTHLGYLQLPPRDTIVINIVDLSVECHNDQDLCRLDYDKKQEN